MKVISKAVELVEDVLNGQVPYKVILVGDSVNEAKRYIQAFYNSNGGTIVFGINKNLVISGIKDITILKDMLDKYINTLTYSIPLIYDETVYQKKNILVVSVRGLPTQLFPSRPHYGSDADAVVYKNGGINKISEYRINCIHAVTKTFYFDSYLVGRYDTKYDDEKLLQTLITKAKGAQDVDLDGLTPQEVLDYFSLRKGKTRNLAYVLSLSMMPQLYFPNLVVKVFKVPSNGKTFILETFDGAISTMYLKTVFFLKQLTNYKLELDGNRVVKRQDYPINAIEEAVFNSLINRDYSPMTYNIPIKIYISDDSIEIVNPGRYITLGSFNNALSKFDRNPVVKRVNKILLDRTDDNSGLEYLFNSCGYLGFIKPVIKCDEETFTITIYKEKVIHGNRFKIDVDELTEFCKTPRSRDEIYSHYRPDAAGGHKYKFLKRFIYPLVESGILEETVKERTATKSQRYVTSKNYENFK